MPAVIYLRHTARHLQRTLGEHVNAWLGELGWTGSTPPFGTTPVQVLLRRMRESDLAAISGNLVAVSFGEEGDDTPAELGGGLYVSATAMYVDVVAVSDPIGLALAGDVKDLLSGRAPTASRYLLLRDYTTDPAGVPIDSHQIEITTVSRVRPDTSEVKLFWQALVAQVELTFPGGGDG